VNRRGKRSIAVDLKSAAGRDVLLKLCETSDALIEGYRPGVMERLGLGPADVSACNPRLVYGRMTGWGQDGPLAATAGHDITYLAITGALHAMGEPGRPPFPPLNLVADYGGGAMMLVTGVLAALLEREKSGNGQVVDAAMVDGVPAMLGLLYSMLASRLWSTERGANLLDGGVPFYRCYETADASFVAVGALEPQFFAILVEKTGIDPTWRSAQMDRRRWPELADTLAAVFRGRSRDHWAAIFEGTDGCVAPVLELAEAADHPHNRARKIHTIMDGVIHPAPAPRFSRTVSATPVPGGSAGSDARAVLMEAGYGETEIEALHRSGVLA
jgi:alpha-methylacyl-CoA racemase